MGLTRNSTTDSIEENFTNDFNRKRKLLLRTKFLIVPIAEQAFSKVREKIENNFFPAAFSDSFKEQWFQVRPFSL